MYCDWCFSLLFLLTIVTFRRLYWQKSLWSQKKQTWLSQAFWTSWSVTYLAWLLFTIDLHLLLLLGNRHRNEQLYHHGTEKLYRKQRTHHLAKMHLVNNQHYHKWQEHHHQSQLPRHQPLIPSSAIFWNLGQAHLRSVDHHPCYKVVLTSLEVQCNHKHLNPLLKVCPKNF